MNNEKQKLNPTTIAIIVGSVLLTIGVIIGAIIISKNSKARERERE